MTIENEDQFTLKGQAWLNWRYNNLAARLSVDRKALHLSCFGKEYKFPNNRFTTLSRYRWLTSVGLRIDHTVLGHPDFIVFWVCTVFSKRRFAALKESLEALGYQVRE
jgi:hypothetical protein